MSGERLYALLPATYRRRDAEQGEPLRALLGVIEGELETLEADVERLRDNWTIETADEWVIPYIGDLLGVRAPHLADSAGLFSLRAYVANTIAYRRRKGTAAVLEQLARDVTGWPARAVEFFERLVATQTLNHLRPHSLGTASLRGRDQLELMHGPFERASHTVELRRIASERGRYNLPNVGLFLWRIQAYPVSRGVARAVGAAGDGRFTFNPLGCNAPLFNLPRTERAISDLAGEPHVPAPLRRTPLMFELDHQRARVAAGRAEDEAAAEGIYLGADPVFQLFAAGSEIPSTRILICNLSNWRRPPTTVDVEPEGGGVPVTLPIEAAVDPVLGRIALPTGATVDRLEVSYVYGAVDDVGGGPYNREDGMVDRRRYGLELRVEKGGALETVQQAIAAWDAARAADPTLDGCRIEITDNDVYGGILAITLPTGGRLAIEAANRRQPQLRLIGTMTVQGDVDSELALSGLLIEGTIELEGDLTLDVRHCTHVPGRLDNESCAPVNPDRDSVRVAAGSHTPTVTMRACIVGPVLLPTGSPGLVGRDTLFDGPVSGGARRVVIEGAPLTLERCTVLGRVDVREIALASEVIFTGPVRAERRQSGCIRFSYVPEGSRTPRRYRCQPDLALEAEAAAAGLPSVAALPAATRARLLARMRPRFESEHLGDPELVQLGRGCPREIREGGEEGAEMGLYNRLRQPQREANLRAALDEYLRFGLEAGLIFVT